MTPRITGILLMVASMVVFTLLDATGKHLVQTLPPAVAVFGRYVVALVLSVPSSCARAAASMVTRHSRLQVLRGLLLMASTILNFIAIIYLQLAQTAAIFFTIPLWVCALRCRSWASMWACGAGSRWSSASCGVLVIMRPGSDSFHWAMLLSIASSFCGAIYNIVTRKVGGRDRAETSLFYVGLVGALCGGHAAALRVADAAGHAMAAAGLHGACRNHRPLHADPGAPAGARQRARTLHVYADRLDDPGGLHLLRRRAGLLDAGGRGHRGGERPLRLRARRRVAGRTARATPAACRV